MMRKDVRLGLAVGGILFGAVLAYVLFFTGGKPNKPVANGGAPASPPPATPNPVDPSPPAPAPDTAPRGPGFAAIDFSGPSAPVPGAAASPPLAQTVTPSPASAVPPSPPATDSGRWSWADALARGALPSARAVDADAARDSHDPTGALDMIPTTRPSGEARRHRVQPGESYWTIAKAEYGNGSYWNHLARANPTVPASRLRAGMTIVIPGRADVVPATVPPQQPPTTQPIDPNTQYEVRAGDSLYRICERLYGDISKIDRLYQLNKDVIGPNPAALKPKTILQLPLPPAPGGIAGAQ